MNRISKWRSRHRFSKRRFVQLYAAVLYNAHIRGFIDGDIYTGKTKALCVPGLNCYSCPGAIGSCPLGALQNALASSANRPAFYIIGILMLFGLLFGRFICGWLCPFGFIQELLYKVPTGKIGKSKYTRAFSCLKYYILAVFVIAIPSWYALSKVPLPAFCKYICPAGTLEGAGGLLANPVNADKLQMLGLLFTRKYVIMVIILLACVFLYRFFCRFLCPLGAIYGLFARIALIGVQIDHAKCTSCGACLRACPMDVKTIGDHECIQCGQCIPVCSERAISIKAGRIILKDMDVNR